MKLSIIIPVYNEEKTVSQIIQKVLAVKFPNNIQKEIVIVDDGSSDKTPQILRQLHKPGIKVLIHSHNRGKGAALRTGFTAATGDLVIIQDADLEYDPQDFTRLLEPIIQGKEKVVYGSRFINYPLRLWGEQKTVMPTHWLGNKLLTLLTNLMYGGAVTDMETCYKLISKKVLDQLDLKSNRFEIEPEITAKILKRGYRIYEVPIKVNPRTHAEGKKISWKDGITALKTLIRYRFTN